MNSLLLSKLIRNIQQKPQPSVRFEWKLFTQDPNSNITERSISVNDIGNLLTSMTFPAYLPGLVKDVKSEEVWKEGDLDKRKIIIEGLKKGDIDRELILAKFGDNNLFLLDGQKRARVIFEAVEEGISIKYNNFPALILENPEINKFSEDLKNY